MRPARDVWHLQARRGRARLLTEGDNTSIGTSGGEPAGSARGDHVRTGVRRPGLPHDRPWPWLLSDVSTTKLSDVQYRPLTDAEYAELGAEAPSRLPTAVSAGLGESSAGGPLGSGMVAGGLGLLALAGVMARRRPVLDESRR